MNEPAKPAEDPMAHATREEIMAALFANMVIQQTNMAMMFLGKVPHPETGQIIHDFEAARMFIDQLEMIEAKTKGNLSKQEDALLKQGLSALHMAFVDAVEGEEKPAPQGRIEPSPSAPAEPPPAAGAPAQPAAPSAAETAPEESRKKFSKKY